MYAEYTQPQLTFLALLPWGIQGLDGWKETTKPKFLRENNFFLGGGGRINGMRVLRILARGGPT